MVRAMLEAMCFQTREVVDAMCQDAGLDSLEVIRLHSTDHAHSTGFL